MEVQERAHNATALLSIVLRRLSPNDVALQTEAPVTHGPLPDAILVEHEQR